MIDLEQNNLKLQAEIHDLRHRLAKAEQQIDWFKQQFKLAQHLRFVRSSDSFKPYNLSLFDEQECDEVALDVKAIDAETVEETLKRPRAQKEVGRKLDTSKLPREQVIHDLSPEEKVCSCSCQLEKIGEDISEEIEIIPAQLKVIEHIQPKYACRACETIQSAKKPERAMAKCMASNGLVADVIVKKYEEHLPLYRQSKIWEHAGIIIPDNTLGNWVNGAADALSPLMLALWKQFAFIKKLQADETTLKILKPDKKGFMWAYHSLEEKNRFIIFEFSECRAGEIPERRLAHFTGSLQTDGYSGYNGLRARSGVTNFGCWDHARRKFMDALKVCKHDQSGIAGQMIHLIKKLYTLEATIKNASIEDRLKARQTHALPILNEIYALVEKTQAVPKSLLGIALTYLKNNKTYLLAYVNQGDMPISNCLVENQIRPLALGRKNWLFAGNPESANKAALLYSLIQTCRMNKINPKKYLAYVLSQTSKIRRCEIDPQTLLPQFIDPKLLAG